jgi:hypothetical protein
MKRISEEKNSPQELVLRWLRSPSVLALIVGFGSVIALLLLPVWPAIGLFYWDIVFFLDAAHRIDWGQIPNIDFFAHFGPLPQYGLWLVQKIFPTANPVLAAQLFYSAIGLPLLALLLTDVKSRLQCALLAGPFIVLLLLPANFFMPTFNFGIDGSGIFNRQAGLSLYLLVACIWWCHSPSRIIIIVSCTLLCLLFTKITVFSVACFVVFYAFLMKRISIKEIGAVVIALGVIVGGLEIATGIVGAYLRDIAGLASSAVSLASNEQKQDPLHRVGYTVWINFGTLVLVGLMIIATLIRDREVFANARSTIRKEFLKTFDTVLRTDGVALGVLSLAALAIESQNSGSQEFAFLAPAVLYVMIRSGSRVFAARAVAVLAAAVLLILGTHAAHRAFLITYQAVKLPRLDKKELLPFQVSARSTDVSFAAAKLVYYSRHQDVFAEFASHKHDLASQNDEGFQLAYLLSVANAVQAIRRWQFENKVELKSVASLDFVDPFPKLLNLKPVVGLGIVMDPYRTVGQWPSILKSLSATDGILVPVCPVTNYRYLYAANVRPELETRRAIYVDPCWTLYLKK